MPVKKLAVYCAIFSVLYWAIGQMQPVGAFVKLVRIQSGQHDSGSRLFSSDAFLQTSLDEAERQTIYSRLRQKAEETRIPPINAKVDPVWKAIPGLNGREIDVDQTYRLILEKGTASNITPVFNEIPPDINLEDLGPFPIYKGNSKKPMVSLMINVAWGNEYIPSILDTLKKEHVHATFFLDGSWLKQNRQMAEAILADGHELSNHAYSHRNMSTLSNAEAESEIAKTEALLKELHVKNVLFAPPSGDYDAETVKVAAKHQLKTVLWTIDTVDWQKPSADWIVRKVSRSVEPGSMILMHPTPSSSEALPELIQTIKSKGLALGTVSELLSPKRVPDIEPPLDF